MREKSYFITTLVLFLILFVAHLVRLIQGWEIFIVGVLIPQWVSWIAVVLTGALAVSGWKLYKR